MILPQRSLVAPGSSLRLQLVYPSAAGNSLTDETAHSLLRRVHLEHLLDRVRGDLDAPLAWAGVLLSRRHMMSMMSSHRYFAAGSSLQ